MSVKLRGCTCALSNMDLNRGALPRPYILWLSWAVLESGWYPKTCQFKGVTSAFPEETPHTESILIILVPSVRGDFVNYIPKLFPWEDYHHIRYSPQIYSSPPQKKRVVTTPPQKTNSLNLKMGAPWFQGDSYWKPIISRFQPLSFTPWATPHLHRATHILRSWNEAGWVWGPKKHIVGIVATWEGKQTKQCLSI